MRIKGILEKAGLIALPIVIIGVFVYLSVAGSKVIVPPSFTTARQNAASVSRDIVALTTSVDQNIQAANAAEAKGDTNAIITAISNARTANAAAYEKAFTLSQNLQQMAQSLNDINSASSRQLAYEAVAVELSLVSEFIAYTGSLNDFLNTLANSIATNGLTSGNSAVAAALKVVNDKAATIDQLNREFNQKMEAFDASVK